MAKSVTTPLPELPLSESLSPTFNLMGQWTWRTLILLLTGLVLFLAWLVAYGDLYKPGSRLGYNLGLVGGIIMLTLLVYAPTCYPVSRDCLQFVAF